MPYIVNNLSVDRSSGIPLYIQIRRELETQIRSKEWSPGDRLPTDRELTETFEVSRATIRQALDSLERDRLIYRERGRGAFIAETVTPQWHLESIAGLSDERELTFTSVVIKAGIETLPDNAASALGLASNSEGVVIERVRSFSDRVFMHVTNYLHLRTAPVVLRNNLQTESLYQLLESQAHTRIEGANRTIISVGAEEPIASLLKVRLGNPLLLVESVSWDPSSRPVDYYVAYVRTEAIKIQVMTTSRDTHSGSFTTANNVHEFLNLIETADS